VKRVSQELGGKSANIVLDDGKFAEGVKRGAAHCFQNCGQSCNAPTRMLVPFTRMEEAMDIASQVATKTTPLPVVNRSQFEKIQRLLEIGATEATLASGGSGLPNGVEKGYFIKPTVFGNVKNDTTIAREEIFGPVLCIIGYNSVQEAISIANDSPYGLAGYVQGEDQAKVKEIARKLRVGNVACNGAASELRAPFGGFKQSGNGREWGRFGLDEFVEIKAVVGFE
jgi:aldehyde dehydrogenase (NAD+)